MAQRLLLLLLIGVTLMTGGCSQPAGGDGLLRAGMVTDAGPVDDKSFNQGTWEGLVKAGRDFQIKAKYLKPAGTTSADYDREIANLHDAGYGIIVTPGFKFENSIYTAQTKYPDTKFVLIDGLPRAPGDFNKTLIGPNTVAINFAEQEAGFLAGVAAALQLPKGDFAFIGGMEIPPVQRFNWGFQQGINYANESLGTAISLRPENVVYQGTFHDIAAGQQLAAQLFDRGVAVIFAAAGGVGQGVINEGVARAKAGKPVWVIGVDVDQYAQGFYDRGKSKSIILTSAMKYLHQATYDMVKSAREGNFPGGRTITYDARNNGVGIPADNPNLSPATTAKVSEVAVKLKSGAIVVADKADGLIK